MLAPRHASWSIKCGILAIKEVFLLTPFSSRWTTVTCVETWPWLTCIMGASAATRARSVKMHHLPHASIYISNLNSTLTHKQDCYNLAHFRLSSDAPLRRGRIKSTSARRTETAPLPTTTGGHASSAGE